MGFERLLWTAQVGAALLAVGAVSCAQAENAAGSQPAARQSAASSAFTGTPASTAADLAYRHGVVYTVDAHDSIQQALAIRAGRIVYVGSDLGLAAFIGPKTAVVDLRGRMLMPGWSTATHIPCKAAARS